MNPNPGLTLAHPYSACYLEGEKGPLSRIGISKVAGEGRLVDRLLFPCCLGTFG